ncbi:MAG: protoglobin domain-containing protein [Caulobacterales bacterium]|nr:protoglobin domain-containing protein [Caulobacterales bacterium]
MSSCANLHKRLAVFRIDEETIADVRALAPLVRAQIEPITHAFYAHFLTFPEVQAVFADPAMLDHAERMQAAHWRRVLRLDLDAEYVEQAVAVGRAHEKAGVAPYLFVSGYQFFLERAAAAIHARKGDHAANSRGASALGRVVMLDLEIALSAFTRELSRHIAQAHAAAALSARRAQSSS